MSLPTGTVTFLFTDVEGSTHLWEQSPQAMRATLARHDALASEIITRSDGLLVKSRSEGDSLFGVFTRATDAAQAAVALQAAFHAEQWPPETPLKVRIALHTGEVQLRDGDYYGAAVNRCARLRAIGHGGQILLSLPTEELIRDELAADLCLRDLGEQRLRDLARPERVFQLTRPGLPDSFPPLKSLDRLPNNLPRQLTSFVGREDEMAQVKKLLRATCLLTLTGAGGSGKSRLSLQVAADLLDEYPDGLWLTELASLSDPALVLSAVASAAGVQENPGKSLIHSLTEAWKTKRLLLLLDNCEHLVDACARLADTILRACPQVTILATSREALNIPGETTWRVPNLTQPSAKPPLPPLETLTQYEAVRLFDERAVSALPSFTVNARNAPAIAQICSRLDGIPLAIELAAARIKALPPEQIARRLDDQFRLLTGGSRTVLPRQQTLRATVDWSYTLLSDAEKTLLRRLSVFSNGWPLAAAEAVCADVGLEAWEVMDTLSHLIDRSLVQVEIGETRYRLLETIRQYGQEKLADAGETEDMRQAHALHFTVFAEETEPHLTGPEQADWLRRLDDDYDNIRAAMSWAMEAEYGVEPGLRMVAALRSFIRSRGHRREGYAWLQKILPRSESAPVLLHARALDVASRFAVGLGFIAASKVYAEESLLLARKLEDASVLAHVLDHSAGLAMDEGDLAFAQSALTEGLALRRASDDTHGVALSLNMLGFLAMKEDKWKVATALFQESLAAARSIDDRSNIAANLADLARLSCLLAEPEAEKAYLEDCLPIWQQLGHKGNLQINAEIALNCCVRGDFVTAEHFFHLGEAYFDLSLPIDKANLAQCRFTLAAYRTDYQGAWEQAQECLQFCRQMATAGYTSAALTLIGFIAMLRRDLPTAKAAFEEGYADAESVGNQSSMINATHGLAHIELALRDLEIARGKFLTALEYYSRKELVINASLELAGLSAVAAAQGNSEQAARLLGAAEGLGFEKALRDLPDNWCYRLDKTRYDQTLATVQAALGAEQFADLRSEGYAMRLEEIAI